MHTHMGGKRCSINNIIGGTRMKKGETCMTKAALALEAAAVAIWRKR